MKGDSEPIKQQPPAPYPPSPPPSPGQTCVFCVLMDVTVLDVSDKWDHTICNFCVWLPPLSTMSLGPSRLWQVSEHGFFYGRILLRWVDIPHLSVHSPACTFGVFPPVCQSCRYERSSTNICLKTCFHFFRELPCHMVILCLTF